MTQRFDQNGTDSFIPSVPRMAQRLDQNGIHPDVSSVHRMAQRLEQNGTDPNLPSVPRTAQRLEQNGTNSDLPTVPATPRLSRRNSRRSGIVNLEDNRLQKQLSSARQNGSVEWDFGGSSMSSSETLSMPDSPPTRSPTLIRRPVELTRSLPRSLPSSPALRHTSGGNPIKKSKLTHSISFAQADMIFEVPSRAKVWTDGQMEHSNSLQAGIDKDDTYSNPANPANHGRKKSIYTRSSIPIQHALRFQSRNSNSMPDIRAKLIIESSFYF